MKVYGASLSPFVRKVLLTLETKGIDYESIPVFPGQLPPNYEKISPLKKMPVLDHNGFTVPDSSVICAYLDEVFPNTPMLPSDSQQRATARFIEEYADTRLSECTGAYFAERVVKPTLFKQPTDEARLATVATEAFPPVLAHLESIAPTSGFLSGTPYAGLADISVATQFLNAQYAGWEVDGRTYPKLASYVARIAASPVVAKRLERERQDLAALQKRFA